MQTICKNEEITTQSKPKVFTYQQAYDSSLDYFKNDLSAKAFVDKYALRDNEDNILEATPDDMHKRIARELARVEAEKYKNNSVLSPLSYDEIYGYLKGFKQIIPQGSPMYGIGNTHQFISISNCFVCEPPEDSYSGIMKTDEQLVQLSKRRCGVGISLDKLRPVDSPTKNSSRMSTGILSWMNRYSNSIREVGQGGRRGALMLTLNVHHPQVLDFIKAKADLSKITGANISVQYTDEFLEALEKDTEYEQRWPVDTDTPTISRMIRAREVWDEAVKLSWQNGEPGLQFIDNVFRESPADCYAIFGFKTITSNPCSEIYLSILDSCRLLVVDLFSCVRNAFTNNAEFDFSKFAKLAFIAQRLMDDIIDLELECINRIIWKIQDDPEREDIKDRELNMWIKIKKVCMDGRRTGTGITALGDTLAALNIPYGSEASIEITDKIYKTLKLSCYQASVQMAKAIGPFPIWNAELEKDCPFLNRIKEEQVEVTRNKNSGKREWICGEQIYEDMQRYGRRNIALLTTAPTGTTSMMAGLTNELYGTTSGIEPLFAASYTRRKKGNPGDSDFRSDFVDQNGDHWMEFEVFHPGIELYKAISGDTELKNNPYVCAPDINWENRVKIQAAAQKHIDHSISSTVNLPKDVKIEEVDKIFRTAWHSGCKGITVYRDGCRTGVLVQKEEKKSTERPKELKCQMHHITVKGSPYFVVVGLKDDHPYEVFAGKNGFMDKKYKEGVIIKKRGGLYKVILEDDYEISPITAHTTDEEDVINRLISISLRQGVAIESICDQLAKAKGDLTQVSKGIARVLAKYVKGEKETNEACPECGNGLIFTEGCKKCSCGYSKCA